MYVGKSQNQKSLFKGAALQCSRRPARRSECRLWCTTSMISSNHGTGHSGLGVRIDGRLATSVLNAAVTMSKARPHFRSMSVLNLCAKYRRHVQNDGCCVTRRHSPQGRSSLEPCGRVAHRQYKGRSHACGKGIDRRSTVQRLGNTLM